MVVRHPFERILSAYRDKLENSTAEKFYYDQYGSFIVSQYRKRPIIGHPEPTFEEFARYLIDINMRFFADEHWAPYYIYCTPCLVNYDIIIHFETLEHDVQLLVKLLNSRQQSENGNHQLMKGLEWKHKSSSSGRRQSSDDIRRSYFSQLDKTTIRQLYEKYRLDFELFGYGDASEFIAMARHN